MSGNPIEQVGADHPDSTSRRIAPPLRTPGSLVGRCDYPNRLQTFSYLSWHLLRSLFMSQESLDQEIAEMHRQIVGLKAEAARADSDGKDAAPSGRCR